LAISQNQERLKELQTLCKNQNPEGKVDILSADLANLSEDFFNKIKDIMPYADILINNAGALINKPFTEISLSEINYLFNVNVIGVINLIKQLIPLLEKSQKPHVLNISSMGGFQGSSKFPGLSIYSSSKAALATLTECLAVEFQGKISFNCLALGAVQTEMLEQAFPGYKAPLSAEKMAEFVMDFALNGHNFFNGKILPVSLSTP